ncbi:MAG TPA: chitobiase/beta-hexosaminidase C-terminal domain-containing protein [Pyrinomonadaceae bacterium]
MPAKPSKRTTLALFGKLGPVRGRARRAGVVALFTALALVVSFVGFGASAQTTQGQVGPINPDTGFPYWYQDSNGLRLELCLDNNPLCLTTVPDQTRPALVANAEADSNFPDEAFWWSGEAALTGANGVSGRLTLASEAAFAARIQNGDQISFGRIRIRIDNLVQGATYRIVHPYGVDVFDNVSSGSRGINYTEDIGIGDFPKGFLNSRIKPFLTWDTYGIPAANIPAGDSAPPAGFVGDPTVNHKVKGSPIIGADGLPQNYFRIERLDPATRQVIQVVGQTNLFTVAGKIAGLAVTATPKGGTYAAPQNVSLVASDPLAMIFYTLDGTDPSDMANPSRTQYSAPLAMAADTTTTLKFVAVNGNLQSSVMTETYVIGAGGGPVDPPPPTSPRLTKTGPINPNTGFPFWYEDANGMRLDLCLDNNPLCLTTVPDTTRRALVAAEEGDSNFPDEAFWWSGEAAAAGAGGVNALVVLGAEAAFANKIQTGDQMAFGRVRIRIDNLVQGGSYKVTHPFGTDEFDNVSGGDGGINFTEDIGTTSFPNGILNSRIGPFLTWDTFGVDPALIPAGDAAPPAGYVGDPAVGHKVKGSPLNQNFFRVEQLDPVTRQVIAVVAETDLFTVAGKLSSLNVVASPYGGAYHTGQAVTLAANDTAAAVFYTMSSTTDGTAPAEPSNPADANNAARIRYTGPVALPTTANSRSVLKFVAVMTDAATGATVTSPTFTESYALDNAAPTVTANPAGGLFNSAQTVSLTASEQATIFFTADGSDPSNPANTSRLRYATPIPVSQTTTLKFYARDLAGNTSPIVTATYTIDTVAPAAPSTPDLTAASDDGVSNIDNVTTDTTPTFTGTAEAGATVKIFVDGVERGSGVATGGSYTVTTSALPTGTHTVTARAIDPAGNVGPLSGSLTISIVVPAPPAAPSNLTVTVPTGTTGRANLAWLDRSTDETSFEVERSTSATTGFVRIATLGANTTAFADVTAPRKTTVFYRVRAVNNNGASGYSNTASGLTK